MDYQTIDRTEQLNDAVALCEQAPFIAVDTEFARFDTYYPIVGLIQICDGQNCFLIDPLALPDPSPLAHLMQAESTCKVFHACSEDLEVFQHSMGLLPAPLFDTQIAAAVLGVGFSMSYQRLVEHYLNFSLPKDQTRSDWLKRPLTASQCDYAALDVVYLYQVYEMQLRALQSLNRLSWVEEECARMAEDLPTMIEPDDFYKKVKGTHKLDRRQLNVLRALCAWREVMARNNDAPRNRVVDQKALILVSRLDMTEKHQLLDDALMTPRQVKNYGDDILSIAASARSAPEDVYPAVIPRDRVPVNAKQLKLLRELADRRAEQLGISPKLLVKRRHLEELIKTEVLPQGLLGWRKEAVGQDLLRTLASLSNSSR